MLSRQHLLALVWFLAIIPCLSWAQDGGFGLRNLSDRNHSSGIPRKALVRRHNPQVNNVGNHQFLLGEGSAYFWVDATALQTFVGDSQFGINMGLNLTDTTRLTHLDMKLDRWCSKADSRFLYNGHYFHVETVCSPSYTTNNWMMNKHVQASLATRITSDSIFEIELSPERFQKQEVCEVSLNVLKKHASIRIFNGETEQWFTVMWRGNASIKNHHGRIVLHCKGDNVKVDGRAQKEYYLEVVLQRAQSKPSDHFFNYTPIVPFTDYAIRTATGWQTFWTECGLADFSDCEEPEARLTEQRMVEALYAFTACAPDDWWLQAPLTMWGFAKQIVMPLHAVAKDHPEKLWKRPELIAAVYLVLQAYTYPTVVERFNLTPEDIAEFHTTIINTYAPYIRMAVDYLQTEKPPVPSFLDRNALMVVAKRWLADADIADEGASSLSESDPHLRSADGLVFHMPLVTDILSQKRDLTVDEQSQLLFSIAAHRYPETWKVKTEYLVPLP